MKTERCQITNREFPVSQLMRGNTIRPTVVALIRKDHPNFDENLYISIEALNAYRKLYLEEILKLEIGELSDLEKEVVKSIHENEVLSANIEDNLNKNLTMGQRIADQIAVFDGS